MSNTFRERIAGAWDRTKQFFVTQFDRISAAFDPFFGPFNRWFYHYMPVTIGTVLPFAIIWILEANVVEQLSDVFSPSSIGHDAVSIQLPFNLLGESKFPLIWLGLWVVFIVVWTLLMRTVLRLMLDLGAENKIPGFREVFSVPRLAPISGPAPEIADDAEDLADRFVVQVSVSPAPDKSSVKKRRSRVLAILAFPKPIFENTVKRNRWHFFKLVLLTWGAISLLPASAVIAYRFMHMDPRFLNPAPVAMIVTIALVMMLCMSVTYWFAAGELRVGFWMRTLLFLPTFAVVLRLYSTIPQTELGKEVRNDGVNFKYLGPINHIKPFFDNDKKEGWEQPRFNDHSFPLIIVTCAGGGTRASLFNAAVLSRLWWEPISDAARKKLNRPALERALTHTEISLLFDGGKCYPGRILLSRMDVLSAVSGGGLAAAYLQHGLLRVDGRQFRNPYEQRAFALKEFFEGSDKLRPTMDATGKSLANAWEPANGDPVQRPVPQDGTSYSVNNDMAEVKRFEDNPFMNAMAQDHLGSIIIGFADPFSGRSRSIEDFWTKKLGWQTKEGQPTRLSETFAGEKSGFLPHLILNCLNTKTGSRIAITHLNQKLFSPMVTYGQQQKRWAKGSGSDMAFGDFDTRRDLDPSKVSFSPRPGFVDTLADELPHYDPTFAEAAHATSNVPIGYALMQYRTESSPTRPSAILKLMDGGLLDNTGIDSGMSLVRNYLGAADGDATKGKINPRVVFLEIDTSELPTDSQGGEGSWLLGNYTEENDAMWRGGLTHAEVASLEPFFELAGRTTSNSSTAGNKPEIAAHALRQPGSNPDDSDPQDVSIDGLQPSDQANLNSQMRYVLGFEGDGFGLFYVRAGDVASDHVPTSWHLSRGDRAKLYRLTATETVRQSLLLASMKVLLLIESSIESENHKPTPSVASVSRRSSQKPQTAVPPTSPTMPKLNSETRAARRLRPIPSAASVLRKSGD